MEYHGTERGKFFESIFKTNYKNWFKIYLKATANEEFNFNDVDNVSQYRQIHHGIELKHYLKVADKLKVYERKNYPETIERNRNILNQYIQLCRSHNVEPIAFMLPFSQVAQKHYPQQKLNEFFEILEPFKEKIFFLNLWKKKFSDDHFRNLTHLKRSGGIECTKIIKACVDKLFDR